MKKYSIAEIFYSLQGEGRYTGAPALFIRFSGCNLRCRFCDTDHSERVVLPADGIIQAAKDLLPSGTTFFNRIIFTGGEPLLQLDYSLLYSLFTAFARRPTVFHIETNGTIRSLQEGDEKPGKMMIVKSLLNRYLYTTVSPKGGATPVLSSGNELKLVYAEELSEADLIRYETLSFDAFYLQPESGKRLDEIIDICKRRPQWNLSLQMQKILQIR